MDVTLLVYPVKSRVTGPTVPRIYLAWLLDSWKPWVLPETPILEPILDVSANPGFQDMRRRLVSDNMSAQWQDIALTLELLCERWSRPRSAIYPVPWKLFDRT